MMFEAADAIAAALLPLSPEQQAVVAAWSGQGACTLSVSMDAAVDETRLLTAIEDACSAHEVLRHAFVRTAGGLGQQCLPELPPLSLQDTHESTMTPDIERGELVRVALIGDGDSRVLVLAVSELVADRGTLQTLLEQIANIYFLDDALEADQVFQYSRFIEWREELASSEQAEQGRHYWSQYLQTSQALSAPRLSYRGRSSSQGGSARALQTCDLDVALTACMAATCEALGSNRAIFVQACWWLLLARLTGMQLCIGGWQHDCRRDYELMQGAVGLYDKVLPVVVAAGAEEDFSAWLARFTAVTAAHVDVQEYWTLDAPLAARLQVGFTVSTAPRLRRTGWQVIESAAVAPQFELALELTLDADGDRLTLHADPGRYSQAAMHWLMEQLMTVLAGVAERPSTRLADVPLMSADERSTRLQPNTAAADFGTQTLLDHIVRWAKVTPEAPAVAAEAAQLSYRQLTEQASRTARWLQAQGVQRGDLVAMSLPRSPQLLVTLLAIWQAGAAYLPLEPEWPAPRRAAVLADARPALVVHAHLSQFDSDVEWRQAALSSAQLSELDDAGLPASTQLGDVAYVLYTSGSTGHPKGVMIEHGALLNYVAAVSEALQLGRSRRWALTSSVAADLGNTALFGALFTGACLVIAGPQDTNDAEAFAHFMAAHQVDGLKIVPSHLDALLECANPHLPRTLVLGGEAAPLSLLERIQQLAPQCAVYNHYGPTETTVGVMVHVVSPDDIAGEVLPLSEVLTNNRVLVLDETLQLVPSGALGQVHVGGAQLCRGYLGREVPGAFVDDPFYPGERLYRTGDLAYVRPEGGLQLAGRADHQVKIRGFRVEPAEIEAALLSCPGVRQAAVLAVPGKESALELLAFMVCEATQAPADWQAQLAARLPACMIPAQHLVLPEFPRLANGKVDRVALAALPATASVPRSQVLPRNPLETTLATCMSELLGRESIGIDDNFFELGGQSLLAIKLAARVRRLLQVEVDPGLVFDCPTVAQLAQRIASRSAGDAAGDVQVVELARGGAGMPLYCFPGTLANGSEFAPLAAALDGERAVQAFVCHSLGPHRWQKQSIQEIAGDCARYIAARSPGQPCALLGWSFGGDLAFETARQLSGRVDVRFVGTVDVSDRRQVLELATPAPATAGLQAVTRWIARSSMEQQWRGLLDQMNAEERAAAVSFLAGYEHSLPQDGPGFDAREYELWVLLRLSWMKRRHFSTLAPAREIALYNWSASATLQDARLCPRVWETLADVRSSQQIAGTTHRGILAHEDFISGVRTVLLGAG
jgi:amino acid adenylation domain-containing protein